MKFTSIFFTASAPLSSMFTSKIVICSKTAKKIGLHYNALLVAVGGNELCVNVYYTFRNILRLYIAASIRNRIMLLHVVSSTGYHSPK